MIDVDSQVWDAFCTRLESFVLSASPPIPYITQGVLDDPPNTGEWLEARFFPNETISAGFTEDGPFDFSGFCQIEVNTRPGSGIMGILALTKLLQDHFMMETVLGPAYVNREPTKSGTPIQSPERLTYVVSVYYASHQMR